MKIGILGAGVVGTSLASGWIRSGHEIMFSSRNPDSPKMQALAEEMNAKVGTVQETVIFGEIVVIALPWNTDLLGTLRKVDNWSDKVVIDTTNRFTEPPPDSLGSSSYDIMQTIGVPVTKAFNTIGAEIMRNPRYGDDAALLVICGDDAHGKRITTQLAEELGFEVYDIGGWEYGDLLFEMTRIWITMVRSGLGRDFAYKLLRR